MKFAQGDIIQNIDPYEGEPEMLIKEVYKDRKEYLCASIEDGKVLWDSIEEEEDMDCYKKVG